MSSTVIKPSRGLFSLNLPELWRYRELFYIFLWRDLKVRYKQTFLGVTWAIFQPFISMVVFTVFFGRFLQASVPGVPYPVFVYLGLIFWNFFSQSLISSANSLVDHESIVKRIYFPRLIIPLSGTLAYLIDFFLAGLVLAAIMFYFHVGVHWLGFVLLPVFLSIIFLTAIGIGLFLASINVKYRDVRYATPFFVQLLLFLSPVIYPGTVVSERLRAVFYLNPIASVIESVRSSLLEGVVAWQALGIAGLISVGLFLFGLYYFRKTERFFADIL